MQISPDQAFAAASHRIRPMHAAKPELLIAGATGVLGNAVLMRLSGAGRYAHTQILAREPMQQGLQAISLQLVADEIEQWPALGASCDVAVVMFEPPRMFYERERALWTPLPAQLLALALWLHTQGVRSLAVVLPHAQGTLPEALKAGLATLDEQQLASIGFDRLILVRSAEKSTAFAPANPLERLAHWMLSIFKFMVPSNELPVRPSKLAEMVDATLQYAPPGISVLGPQEVWALSQLDAPSLIEKIHVILGCKEQYR